jgi:hypothetical protein
MLHMITTFALECPVYVLLEERTEPYMRYGEGVPERKQVLGAKNALQGQTCSGLGRCGA